MNERIRALAKEAGLWRQHYDIGEESPERLEEFAELIVAECTEQVRGQYVPVLEDKEMMKDTHWDGYVECGVDSVVAIRIHFFGVE